jgi:hypothetical protein
LLDVNNNDIYEATQKQRYNERQIRSWKHRKAELEASGLNSSRAELKIKEWQKRNRILISDMQMQNIDLRRDYLREAA